MDDDAPDASSLVVCSLEAWGTVRRRIRILVDELVDRDPVAAGPLRRPGRRHPLRTASRATVPASAAEHSSRSIRAIHVLRPRKWLPRVARTVRRPVARAPGGRRRRPTSGSSTRWSGSTTPSYARYALGDRLADHLRRHRRLAAGTARRRARRPDLRSDDGLLLERSGAVVVCSPTSPAPGAARRAST